MTVRPVVAWYDLWVGLYWDRKQRRLYVLPLPCLGVVFDFGPPRPACDLCALSLDPDRAWQGCPRTPCGLCGTQVPDHELTYCTGPRCYRRMCTDCLFNDAVHCPCDALTPTEGP